MARINCPKCGQEKDDTAYTCECGYSSKTNDRYKLVCYANYCGWESEITEDYNQADGIEKCPRCKIGRGNKLVIEKV